MDRLSATVTGTQSAFQYVLYGTFITEHINHYDLASTYIHTVDLKISTLVYRSLAGTAPVYLADECTLVTAAGRHHLWSADSRTCLVKRSRNQFGDRCFATAGQTLWNNLSEQLRQPDITFGQFKRSLETIMFG